MFIPEESQKHNVKENSPGKKTTNGMIPFL